MATSYFFGCSMTEASESADHELLGISREECDKLKKKHNFLTFGKYLYAEVKKKHNLKDSELYDFITERYRKKSWAKYLSNYIKTDYVNLAVGGTGFEYLLMVLEKHIDLINPREDIVFIGLTSMDRYFVLDDYWAADNRFLAYGDHPYDVLTENTFKWNFWRQIRHITLLLESRNIRYYLVPVMLHETWYPCEDKFFQFGYLVNKFKENVDDKIVPVKQLLTELRERVPDYKKFITGHGHVYEEAHQLYAQLIYEAIKKDFPELNK